MVVDSIYKIRAAKSKSHVQNALTAMENVATIALEQLQRGVHANPGVSGETAVEHIRNAYTMLKYLPSCHEDGDEAQRPVIAAILDRLDLTLADLERWRGNPRGMRLRCAPKKRVRGRYPSRAQSLLRLRPLRGSVRQNPALAIINPPAPPIEATWAKIEYQRPDDPEGKRIVRVHEFKEGFVATPLADGGILLRHPGGQQLWTKR
jgi:hypothetical protein